MFDIEIIGPPPFKNSFKCRDTCTSKKRIDDFLALLTVCIVRATGAELV